MKKRNQNILLTALAVFALLSVLIGAFETVAEPVAKIAKKPVAMVQQWARTAAAVAIAVIVIAAGLMSMAAAPVLGVTLLAVGIITAGLSLWPYLNPKTISG